MLGAPTARRSLSSSSKSSIAITASMQASPSTRGASTVGWSATASKAGRAPPLVTPRPTKTRSRTGRVPTLLSSTLRSCRDPHGYAQEFPGGSYRSRRQEPRQHLGVRCLLEQEHTQGWRIRLRASQMVSLPHPSRAWVHVASFDYSQQEFAIAAVLSGDEAMMDAYRTGDAYMGMAVQAGRAPPGATKSTHAAVRGIFKTISLGLLYGAGAATIGRRLCVSPSEAKALLRNHRAMYPKYWAWNERIGHQAMYYNELSTVFGWKTRPYPGIEGEPPNIRTLRNFPMQANGGEVLRLAIGMLVESGVDVCALVHDAIVIISPTSRFEADRAKTMAAMKAASRRVLGGFAVDVEMNSASYPNRYIDKDGAAMWRRIEQLLRTPTDAAPSMTVKFLHRVSVRKLYNPGEK